MARKHYLLLSLLCTLTSCSFNPFTNHNDLTGSAAGTAIGAGVGAGGAALLGGKPVVIGLAGLSGAAIGYYVTTLRYASGGILLAGGQVYTLGEYATIEIPSDQLFETNSADFLTDAGFILNSAVAVLNRYPDHNIMVSGNTSGFGATKYERNLSEARARQVSSYLWLHGISEYKKQNIKMRNLSYVGYGNYFPIANNIHNDSIRQNSRIQITAFPSKAQLQIAKHQTVFRNIGALNEPNFKPERSEYVGGYSETYLYEPRDREDLKGELTEGPGKNVITPNYYSADGDYRNVSNAPQTNGGGNVEKQGVIARDLKGELFR